jgi:hypothetical protein
LEGYISFSILEDAIPKILMDIDKLITEDVLEDMGKLLLVVDH